MVLAGKTGGGGGWTRDDLGIAAGEIHWIASAPGRGRGFGTAHKAAGDAPVEILAQLAAGSEIVGDVVDRDGKAVGGATIVARATERAWRDSASSDPAGGAPDIPAPTPYKPTL